MTEEISASENKFVHANFKTRHAKSTEKDPRKSGTEQPIQFVIRYLFQSATIFPKTELEELPTKLKVE